MHMKRRVVKATCVIYSVCAALIERAYFQMF